MKPAKQFGHQSKIFLINKTARFVARDQNEKHLVNCMGMSVVQNGAVCVKNAKGEDEYNGGIEKVEYITGILVVISFEVWKFSFKNILEFELI